MSTKTAALVTTVVLLVSLDACIPIKSNYKRTPDALAGAKPYKENVVAVQKKTGERLSFPAGRRATIAGSKIVMPYSLEPGAPGSLPARFPTEAIFDIEEDSKGRISGVALKDGRYFRVLHASRDVQGVEIQAANFYRYIPLSDVDLVWVRTTNWGMTTLATTVLWGGAVAAIALAAGDSLWKPMPSSGGESCPFVYSFDGKEYVLDAEPYGGSVCPGLERADWMRLDNLRAVDGRYKILLSNELGEIEHVDELKLVVVDHPAGVAVSPELSGRMRTIASLLAPSSARDADGRDVLPLLAVKDETFWLGRVEGRDPDNDSGLKEEIVLEFAKPAGARQAKLVADAWTTAWGSQAIRPLLASQGRELGAYFEKVNAGGPALLSLMSWFAREEMYNLQVRVETRSGWTTKALVYGGGPVVARDKTYPLDLGDVPGDMVRIKLTPAAGFWMIDRLALDFSEDAAVQATEISAASALDAAGRDIRGDLSADDNAYFVIPKGSRPAALEFAAPAAKPGLARSVFLKARGYYDILLDAGGAPTLDLDEMMESPGETLRFLLRQHPALAKPVPRANEGRPRTP